MLPYFKKYAIFVCICAVVPVLIATTVWPLITGQIMASSIAGLALMFALFIAGLLVGYFIFSRVAENKTEAMLNKYNMQCDPQALIDEGSGIMHEINLPLNQTSSWFAGYYAQAMLDVGDSKEAAVVLQRMEDSVPKAKNAYVKCAVISNMLPLVEKVEGATSAIKYSEEALQLCSESKKANDTYRDYLLSQKTIYEAETSDDAKRIASLSEGIRSNARYPMRIRVEYAWKAANAYFKLNNSSQEISELKFIVEKGGTLKLKDKAKSRLSQLNEA